MSKDKQPPADAPEVKSESAAPAPNVAPEAVHLPKWPDAPPPPSKAPFKPFAISCEGFEPATGLAIDESQAVQLYRDLRGISGTQRCVAVEVKPGS